MLWTASKAGGPKRANATVAVRTKLYTFGECYDDRTNGEMLVHIFNTVSLCWKKLPPVKPGRGPAHLEYSKHTAVLIEEIVYIWGGSGLFAFNVDTHMWFKPSVSGSPPEGRDYHSACALKKVMFIYGGYTQQGRYANDMYKFDTCTMVWSLINPRGPPLPGTVYHSATVIGTKIFVFGGYQDWCIWTKNIIVFDTETNDWLRTPSAQLLPEHRCAHSAFTYNGELYIFGCWNANKNLNDVWKFSPDTFTWRKVEPKGKGPSPRYSTCCSVVGERVIISGGYKRNGGVTISTNELYILDLNPSLKTICKLAVIQYGLDQSELPHNIRWELVAMTTNSELTANKIIN